MQGHCGPDLCARWSWSGILFLNDRKSSCEVNSSLLVRVLKLRFCAVLRLKRWSVGCSAAVSGWSLWEWWQPVTAVTRVNGSNVGGAPSFFNPRQTPEQSESVTTFCSDWFLHRSALSPCTWRGTFIQTSITKKSVFTGLRLFHQTCCIRTQFASVFSGSIDCIQSHWKSWRSTFI